MPIMSCRLREIHDTLHTIVHSLLISTEYPKNELQYNVLSGIMIFWRELQGILQMQTCSCQRIGNNMFPNGIIQFQ